MNRAFTIVELLLYAAIFAAVMVVAVGTFVTITRVQTSQTAAAEVQAQSQFLLQQIQFQVQQSSLIQMSPDTSSTTLELRMAASSSDPTYFTVSASGTVYLQQGSGALQALTSPKVAVTNLSFTKRSNPPAHDTVSVAFTMTYNPSNPLQAFSELFQTSVARVSAATFDSSVYPSSTAENFTLGNQTNMWTSLNGIINFVNGSTNVGIGTTAPAAKLQVSGGGILLDNGQYIQGYDVEGTIRNMLGKFTDDNTRLGTAAGNGIEFTEGGTVNLFIQSGGNVGIGIGTTTPPSYKLDVASAGATTARFGTAAADTVVVGGGAGKITAGTYDPIYSISGEKYATYGAGMTGEKEETTGVLQLQPAANGTAADGTAANGTWKAVIDFGNLKKGSDLWLFSQVTDFGQGLSNLSVLLTPAFDGNAWYEKDAVNDRLTVYAVPGSSASSLASAPGSLEVSYRLTAPRFDSQQWPNTSDDAITPGISVPVKP